MQLLSRWLLWLLNKKGLRLLRFMRPEGADRHGLETFPDRILILPVTPVTVQHNLFGRSLLLDKQCTHERCLLADLPVVRVEFLGVF